jgi:hypothetical protein
MLRLAWNPAYNWQGFTHTLAGANPLFQRRKVRVWVKPFLLSAMENLTQEELQKWVTYDPNTGIFKRIKGAGTQRAGSVMGCIRKDGYLTARVNNKLYLLHRLAWVYIHGAWPANLIDHKNHIKTDNRIDNLRDATPQINSQNRISRRPSKSTDLPLGVVMVDGKYKAQISLGKKNFHLGRFDTAELAHAAYLEAKRKIHIGCLI